ncbi:MAG: CIA30 family protein [Treponema sp.]|nr:CIA30 family protein [Treponema sp.]
MKKIIMILAAALLTAGAFAQTGWYGYSDKDGNNGSSTVKVVEANGGATMTGTVTTKYQYGFAGMGIDADPAYKTARGIRLTVKGDGKLYNVRVETTDRPDYCFHEFTFKAPANATTIEIPYSKLFQEEWGKQKAFDPAKIRGISFQTVGQPIASFNLTCVKVEPLK